MKKNSLIVIILFLSSLLILSPAYAQFDFFKKTLGGVFKEPAETVKQTSLSDTEIGQGLKEALKVGINNTFHRLVKQADILIMKILRFLCLKNLR